MSIMAELGAPEYAGLIFIFTSLLIAVNWAWIDANRPSRKFSEIHDEIEAATKYCAPLNFQLDLDHIHAAEREALRYRLAKLKIGLPRKQEELQKILPRLLAYSKTGRIAEARKLTAKWL